MLMKFRWWQACLFGATLVFPGALQAGEPNGRWWRVDNCATIPKGAQPAPNGTYVNKFIEIQAGTAEADDFVLYKHMWFRGGKELGPLGRYQLDLITRRLPEVPFPVVIETSQSDTLDEQRREVVIALLAMRGLTDPSRVIVAYPIAEGLYGEESVFIYNQILFGGFGVGGPLAGFGFGGFGGGGFGGGGFGGVGFP